MKPEKPIRTVYAIVDRRGVLVDTGGEFSAVWPKYEWAKDWLTQYREDARSVYEKCDWRIRAFDLRSAR